MVLFSETIFEDEHAERLGFEKACFEKGKVHQHNGRDLTPVLQNTPPRTRPCAQAAQGVSVFRAHFWARFGGKGCALRGQLLKQSQEQMKSMWSMAQDETDPAMMAGYICIGVDVLSPQNILRCKLKTMRMTLKSAREIPVASPSPLVSCSPGATSGRETRGWSVDSLAGLTRQRRRGELWEAPHGAVAPLWPRNLRKPLLPEPGASVSVG